MSIRDNKAAIEILIQTLKANPELWETRKKTAEILYMEEQYVEAADVLWGAPEIPSTDTDIAFVIKLISRAQPNRAIRMVYEIVRRNHGKPDKNMAVARALNEIGMYMEASRFYGAALASDPSLFDINFEKQVLWLDDSNRLVEEWQKSDQDSKPPLDMPRQDIHGGTFSPSEIPESIAGQALADNIQNPTYEDPSVAAVTASAHTAPAQNPLMTPPPVHRREVTPAAMLPTADEVDPSYSPAPVRHANGMSNPALAQAVPTQPLQVATARAVPAPTSSMDEKEEASAYTAIGNTTGKLLTPSKADSPRLKLL